MDTPKNKSWFKKKRYLLPLAIASLFVINSDGNQTNQYSTQIQKASYIETTLPQVRTLNQVENAKTDVTNNVSNNTELSNDNYYKNSAGNTVHSPAYTRDNSIPAGASAQCRDGTYSFSQSRRGTCSHHGGVARWL